MVLALRSAAKVGLGGAGIDGRPRRVSLASMSLPLASDVRVIAFADSVCDTAIDDGATLVVSEMKTSAGLTVPAVLLTGSCTVDAGDAISAWGKASATRDRLASPPVDEIDCTRSPEVWAISLDRGSASSRFTVLVVGVDSAADTGSISDVDALSLSTESVVESAGSSGTLIAASSVATPS